METRRIHITGKQSTRLRRMARKGDVVRAVRCDESLVPLDKSIRHVDDIVAPELISLLSIGESNPLQLLVPDEHSRRWTADIQTKQLKRSLPSGSFLQLLPGDDAEKRIALPQDVRIYIEAPELSVLRAAMFWTDLLLQNLLIGSARCFVCLYLLMSVAEVTIAMANAKPKGRINTMTGTTARVLLMRMPCWRISTRWA